MSLLKERDVIGSIDDLSKDFFVVSKIDMEYMIAEKKLDIRMTGYEKGGRRLNISTECDFSEYYLPEHEAEFYLRKMMSLVRKKYSPQRITINVDGREIEDINYEDTIAFVGNVPLHKRILRYLGDLWNE